MSSGSGRRRAIFDRPLVQDTVMAVLLALAGAVSVAIADAADSGLRTPALGYGVLVMSHVPLIWRRRAPVGVWALVGVGTAVYGLAGWVDPPLYAGAMLAVYSLATYAGRRVAAILGAATIALTALAGVVDPQPHDLNDVLVPTLASAIAWLAGFATAAHRRTIALLTERANRLERDRAADARRVAQEERLLMARELHDITAHHLSVIAVEAEAGGSILPERVEDARSMFQAIAGNARTALTDLRRTLGALRDGESAEREPQPGLGDLPALLDQVRETGVTVRLTSRGSPLGVPAGHGRSAYRIVQEALTNAVRHSGAGTIEICLDYSDSALDIDVQDDGTGPRPSGSPSGHGLLGMRERVRLLGGMLDLGVPATGHGFRVHARLPR